MNFDIYTFLDNIKIHDIGLSSTGDNKQDLIYFSSGDNKYNFTYSAKEKYLYVYSDKYKNITSKIKLADIYLIDLILNAINPERRKLEEEQEETVEVVETEEEREDRLLKEEFGELYLIENQDKEE